MTDQASIQLTATGELVAFHQEGVTTYRFEKDDSEIPLVMMLHTGSESPGFDLEQFQDANITITIEYQKKNE